MGFWRFWDYLFGRSQTTDVLIVGAGSTGLALAQGLKKAGIACIVVEKHNSIDAQPRDWNMGLHWGAESLKTLVPEEIWAHLQSTQVDPSQPTAEKDALTFLNAQSGSTLASIPVQFFHRLRRRKLQHLLARGVHISFNRQLRGIQASSNGHQASAHFAQGPPITARLIVGTDGARSSTRQTLLGADHARLRQLPYCATFIQARYTASQARFLRSFHPLFFAGVNPAGYFSFFGLQHAEDPARPESWTFFFYISWYSSLDEQKDTAQWSNAQRLRQVKAFAKTFTDPWRSAVEWLPDDHQVWYMGLTDFDPGAEGHRWDNRGGRVTLAGDAAHAMTYQRGQGLNHSVTDAARLVEAVKEFVGGRASQSEAVGRYEEEMIARAGGEVRMSSMNTEMLHDWGKVLQSPVLTAGMARSDGD